MQDTITAIATPAGRGGVGILRLSGPDALRLAQALSPQASTPKPRIATLRSWLADDASIIDQGIVLYFAAPNSYTGEDVVELQTHGSPIILQQLMQRLLSLGARMAEAGEFTRRAVEHGRMDLTQAEAVIACIDAQTERAAKLAQQQLGGAFGKQVRQWMGDVEQCLALIEACLDFSDEELPDHILAQTPDALNSLQQQINMVLAQPLYAQRLFEGVRIALIGAPNVGKSSLLNYLCQRERAIVSDTPGTTRDTIEVDFAIAGVPVQLVDTAGIREHADAIEAEGIRRSRIESEQADFVIAIADATRPETLNIDTAYDLLVINKIDQMPCPAAHDASAFLVSIKEQQGLDRLMQELGHLLGDDLHLDESQWLVQARHRHALEHCAAALRQATQQLHAEQLELVSFELRQVWAKLGEIIGHGDIEDILGRIFSSFCIGK